MGYSQGYAWPLGHFVENMSNSDTSVERTSPIHEPPPPQSGCVSWLFGWCAMLATCGLAWLWPPIRPVCTILGLGAGLATTCWIASTEEKEVEKQIAEWASGATVGEYSQLISYLWPQRSAKMRSSVASALAQLSPQLPPTARLAEGEWRPLYRVLHAFREGTSRDTHLPLAIIDLMRIDGGAESARQLERLLKSWHPFPYQAAVHAAAISCLSAIRSSHEAAERVRGLLHPADAPVDDLLRPADDCRSADSDAELRQSD